MRPRHWDNKLDIGTHQAEKDEAEPKLPEGTGLNCPHGHGDCTAIPVQFYSFTIKRRNDVEFDEDYDEDIDDERLWELIDGHYHKAYATSCCFQADLPLEAFDLATEEVVGEIKVDGTIAYYKPNDP